MTIRTLYLLSSLIAAQATAEPALTGMNQCSTINRVAASNYTDAEAIAAMLTANGAGSALDADLLAHQAKAIFAAAHNEVRFPISQENLPLTIERSGSFYFTESLTHDGPSAAIRVLADHVTIDLMGFTLSGPGKNTKPIVSGIEIGDRRTNVTVMNGTVREFGRRGVGAIGSAQAHRIVDLRAIDNGRSGIWLSGSNHQVRGCTAEGNGQGGIRAGSASLVSGNTAHRNGGIGISSGVGSIVVNNTAKENQDGLFGSDGTALVNNAAMLNSGHGIVGLFGTAMVGNTATSNGLSGISGEDSNLIKDNNVYANNTSGTLDMGGIVVFKDSRVVGNTLADNSQSGIYVVQDGNIIDRNHVAASTTCFNFTDSGNAYRDNTASGCTAAFGGPQIGATTDGGGNLSF